jgi:hypothetical protein
MLKLTDSLHQLIQRQITERGIVVWYDPERAYSHAVDQLALKDVAVIKYEDGYFRLREQMEPWLEWIDDDRKPIADKEVPPKLLVYIPKARSNSEFALVEAETAGVVIEPGAPVAERNTRLAALVERVYAKISPEKAGHIARQVEDGLLSFEEVEQMAQEAGSAATGALNLIFGQASPLDVLLLFASTSKHDSKITEKNAAKELAGLIESEVGLSTDSISSVGELRDALASHLLLAELAMEIPQPLRTGALETVQLPEKAVQRDTIRHLCKTWRNRIDLQDAFATTANQLETALGLESLDLPDDLIENIETFAALDKLLLLHTGDLLLGKFPTPASERARKRRLTFWNRRSPEIQLQWSLVEVAANLLGAAHEISTAVKKRKWALDELISAYTSHAAPWMRLDTLSRHLESRYARFDFEISAAGPDWEKVMARCRSEYIATLDLMAEAYTRALEAADFRSDEAVAQSLVFKSEVAPLISAGKKTAYLLVDALRYEMATELVEGLEGDFSINLRPGLGQLPGITPVGMASLMPGAEDGLSLEKHASKLHVSVGGRRITDRASRMAWLQEKTGGSTLIVKLGEIIRLTPTKKKVLTDANLIVVTSQEIDRLGEGESEDDEARVYMDDVLEKLRRGIRNLAAVGICELVISADHGFIFAEGFEAGLKMDVPGGETVDLHSRCWIGVGGTSAEGFFRVPANSLEMGGSLECAFPRGLGTFKVKGGAGAYFHGGASLQEQVLPIVHLTRKTAIKGKGVAARLVIGFPKNRITNRFFSATLSLESEEIFTPEAKVVRVELVAGSKAIVGHAAMAAYGFEEGTRELVVEPNQPNSVTMMLTSPVAPEQLSIRVVNSKNDVVLAALKDIPVNLAL